jgi:hypothetical protein
MSFSLVVPCTINFAYMCHIHTKLKFACIFSNHFRGFTTRTAVPKYKFTRLMCLDSQAVVQAWTMNSVIKALY